MALGAIGRILREAESVVHAFGGVVEVVTLLDQFVTHVGLVDHVRVIANRAAVEDGLGRAHDGVGAGCTLNVTPSANMTALPALNEYLIWSVWQVTQ